MAGFCEHQGKVQTAYALDPNVYDALKNAAMTVTKSAPVLIVLIGPDGKATGWANPVKECGPLGAGAQLCYVDFHAVIVRSNPTCQICWYENGVRKCLDYPCP
jgi:hypothetical protein